ncbi:DUF4065 domain-containing protein [Sphingomonas populi]|uniref:DUF4065 domain-containing protein n=1 Tax=Sphingomonas populi TaxID=2484750 RepID=A0A4Q6XLD9_9SPHN|nr:type II toxin-antitoxin system antitoxin SocA domain-containing protein [Sphingomonas populi]RZF60701.1 DUF4065 domain-containing protein [Sphingomonas populi]
MEHSRSDNSLMKAFAPVDAKGLSNLILDWSSKLGVSITPMKLQKLLYYCHADFLIQTGIPLIQQDFEAWEYGPVIPCIFQEFKQHGSNFIETRAYRFNPISCERELATVNDLGNIEDIVRKTFDAYVRYTASTLSNMTHSETGPWAETLRRFSSGSLKGRCIENDVIAKHHRLPLRESLH